MTVKRILIAGVAVLAACGVLGMVPAAAQGSSASVPAWTQQKTPTSHPSARSQAAMAYDAATSTVVLFGGFTTRDRNVRDTWTWG